ncbi:hypothetical protein [Shewanella sp. GutDb-MelDb]|uniref:hypothetical protein n=1 Tax=Shewanella sp. GutDb-MelDb TaxID=2058316 RepID=UPI000C7D737F|nr:hypothetical protein [Shewanella sp. GutDb-MelDb]PKG58304.1 hypothetical protein CXF82_05125 [Shewanella sp. GutDb-MelDb]
MKNVIFLSHVICASCLLVLSMSVNAKAPLEGEPEWENKVTQEQIKAQQEKEKLELLLKQQEESQKDKEPNTKE